MNRTAAIVTAAATLAVAAGAAFALWPDTSQADQPVRTMVVNGNITLTTTHVNYMTGTLGEDCYGTGPFKDMVEGARVTVYDGAGKALATGELRQGSWYDSCVFPFSVKQVPESDMIQVEVGGHGKVPFELDAVKSGGVKLTLGP